MNSFFKYYNTAAGGFPGWLSNTAATARSNETEFVDAWQLYVQQFAETTSKYQYPDGPVIGNVFVVSLIDLGLKPSL